MLNDRRFILASASIWRKELLCNIGYKPDLIVSADIDETPKPDESNRLLSMRLAMEKALLIADKYPGDIILGADTVVSISNQSMPKALTVDDAKFCINKLSGRRHKVYTGIAVVYNGKVSRKVVTTTLKFKRLSSEEKDSYISSKEWYGKAGGYGLQGYAAAFVEWLNGSYTSVIGLPLCETYKILVGFGLKPKHQILREDL
ncbi:Maf-like protein [Candidatus Cyrtobacter comes]|uniref:Nucleoside triphosphate pyrophosphatase n=1 Tax=Candidatus Cyrtobacter comes TaxID=675776 RepID=A0ABU5L7H6_9RICK|nr:nucleoside triphosphate pyrophosphatase [Candidatus Cyrtobacter comes]MDZ5762087.1 Maf-like protein [Candidatus Cyrtobacter comes]